MATEESGSMSTVGPFLQEILGIILANMVGWRFSFGFDPLFARNSWDIA
jgi:hypothetical protein